MNIPAHFSESLEQFFWLKILKFFDADPESGIFSTPWIRDSGCEHSDPDKHSGSATIL